MMGGIAIACGVVSIVLIPVAYWMGKYVGYGDGYEDAVDDVLRHSREEHYLTD